MPTAADLFLLSVGVVMYTIASRTKVSIYSAIAHAQCNDNELIEHELCNVLDGLRSHRDDSRHHLKLCRSPALWFKNFADMNVSRH